ncbi:MAG: hypothetical protein HYW86_03900 [Candidatus Roizmanbacteria bacterium]|nr:MAG: hypothetical protein HYW86_03900 [Candidatus Roizmanbacteria bacterium]
MSLPFNPKVNVTISNVLELAGGIGGVIVIGTTSLQLSPDKWQYLANNSLGVALILIAVWLYHKEKKHEVRATLIHGAFNALKEILQREAEQLANIGEKEKLKLVVDSLDKAPDKFFNLLVNLLGKKV